MPFLSGKYSSYTNACKFAPYKKHDFLFSSLSANARLRDKNKYSKLVFKKNQVERVVEADISLFTGFFSSTLKK